MRALFRLIEITVVFREGTTELADELLRCWREHLLAG